MKTARATCEDLRSAHAVVRILGLLAGGDLPADAHDGDAETAEFDIDDPAQCRTALTMLLDVAATANLERVVFGMSVLLDPRNQLLDANADTLEKHPSIEANVAEISRLNAIINTQHYDDFIQAVSIEAEHQRQKWGSSHDSGKTPADWYWVLGHLGGKAVHAHSLGDLTKAEHHIITTAALCLNWHRAMFGKTDMRPGIGAGQATQTSGDAA